MGNAPINVEVKALCVYLFTTAHYLQLFCLVGKLPTQQKEVMKNNCIWTRMFIERKETNNTFCEYSDTVRIPRFELGLTLLGLTVYKTVALTNWAKSAYLSTHTTTMHIIMQADTYKLIHHLPASQTTYSQVQSY